MERKPRVSANLDLFEQGFITKHVSSDSCYKNGFPTLLGVPTWPSQKVSPKNYDVMKREQKPLVVVKHAKKRHFAVPPGADGNLIYDGHDNVAFSRTS